MCHLILILPFIGLGVFLFLPLPQALALYLPIAFASAFLYFLAYKSMRAPQKTGVESAIGERAEVVERLEPGQMAQYLVRHGGELWSATSPENLATGEKVKIIALEGISLVVEREQEKERRLCRES